MLRVSRMRFICICVMIIMIMLTGCSFEKEAHTEENTNEGKITIGVAHSDFEDVFLSFVLKKMQNYSTTQTDIDFHYVDAKNDSDTQIKQVEDFIKEKVNVIVAIPVDKVSAELMVDRAKQAKIPIVLTNRESTGREDAFVATDYKQAGVLQMEAVAKMLNGEGQIAIMNGQMGHDAQVERTAGIKEVLEKYPKIKLVTEGTGNWYREDGEELMTNWLEANQKFDAVVANNDEMIIGAINAVEKAGIDSNIIFAGVDGTLDALDYMKKNKLQLTVYQNGQGIAEVGLETAIKLAKNEKVEKRTNIPYEVITKNKVEEYEQKWQ